MMNSTTKDLPGSGTIKLSEVKAEFGKGNNLLDYLGEGGVTSSAPLKLTDFYGAASGNSIDIQGGAITYSESQLQPYGYGGYDIDKGFDDFFVSTAKGGDLHYLYMFTEKVISANQDYAVSYDLTFLRPAAGASVEIYFSLVPNADPLFVSDYPMGYQWKAEDSQKIITGIPGQSQWQKYDNNAWVNFNATRKADRKINISRANLRVSGSFNYRTGSSGPYQMGIALKSKVGGTNGGLIHLCVNKLGVR